MSTRRFAVTALAGLLLLGSLTGCAPTASTYDQVLARGELVVGVKADSPPFGVQEAEGSFWGFDVDLAARLAEKLGVKIRCVAVQSATRIDRLNAGECDLLAAAMTITRERERRVDFSLPYFATEQAFLVPADSTVGGYLDLAGKKVGAVRGTTSAANLREVQPDAELVLFDAYPPALAALKAGQLDALTTDYVLLVGLLMQEKLAQPEEEALAPAAALKIVGRFGSEPYGLALRQNDSKFRDAINNALQELWDAGTLQSMTANWFNERGRCPVEVRFTMVTFPKGEAAK